MGVMMNCQTPNCTGKPTSSGKCWTCNQFNPDNVSRYQGRTVSPDPERVRVKNRLDDLDFERELALINASASLEMDEDHELYASSILSDARSTSNLVKL